MTVRQHAGFNALLNSRVEEQASPSYRGPRVKHQRTREVDHFHETADKKKVRVTMTVSPDGKTQTPKPNGIIEKERIANMNISSPKQAFDYRISVSAEKPRSFYLSFPFPCLWHYSTSSALKQTFSRKIQRSDFLQPPNPTNRFDERPSSRTEIPTAHVVPIV